MNVLIWMLSGLIIGIVANAMDPYFYERGTMAAILLSIVGSLVGGFAALLLFSMPIESFSLLSFLTAVAGSLLLLFVARVTQGR